MSRFEASGMKRGSREYGLFDFNNYARWKLLRVKKRGQGENIDPPSIFNSVSFRAFSGSEKRDREYNLFIFLVYLVWKLLLGEKEGRRI
ncbi:hypothetical protein AVEN_242720-1 [Araneus ventricosus]|uniref:Uncharacterized protein n=1 Tax=Araneus ventricosus TaxID=182803 RepID=A0A4Y2SWN0_ARAVE|nr:hypothetical protein AVEN_242720-1 [Araneus ventricosus]